MTIHQFPVAPRSPQVARLLQRTAEITPLLPANEDADADLFPPAYIAEGRELDRALHSLGYQPLTPRRADTLAVMVIGYAGLLLLVALAAFAVAAAR